MPARTTETNDLSIFFKLLRTNHTFFNQTILPFIRPTFKSINSSFSRRPLAIRLCIDNKNDKNRNTQTQATNYAKRNAKLYIPKNKQN